MYKQDLTLNNLQWLTCHKTKQNQSTLPRRYFWKKNLLTTEELNFLLEIFLEKKPFDDRRI